MLLIEFHLTINPYSEAVVDSVRQITFKLNTANDKLLELNLQRQSGRRRHPQLILSHLEYVSATGQSVLVVRVVTDAHPLHVWLQVGHDGAAERNRCVDQSGHVLREPLLDVGLVRKTF